MAARPKKSSPNKIEKSNQVSSRTEENLQAVFAHLEDRLPQQLSDRHIDRYFDSREKLYEYIRDDHKDSKRLKEHGRRYTLYYIAVSGAITLLFAGIIAWRRAESLDKFLELFFAFLGGTGFGTVVSTLIQKHMDRDDER